jgi:DNA-binding MarR family transcriptional regulator
MTKTKLQNSVDTIAGECIAVRLRMLNRVVTNIYDETLRPLGLKVSQMNILVATAKLGTASPADVCGHLHLDVSTLSRNVERMKNRGWLETVPDEDGRAQPFRLTAAGSRLLQKTVPVWNEAQQRVQSLLGEGFVDRLGEAVLRIRQSKFA